MTKMMTVLSLSCSLLALSLSHNAFADKTQTEISQAPAATVEASMPGTPKTEALTNTESTEATPKEVFTTPAQQLTEGLKALSDFINSAEKVDDVKLTAVFDERLAPLFDFDEMGRLIGGRYYYTMDKEAQSQFQSHLKGWFLHDLSKQLLSLSGEKPKLDAFPPYDEEWGTVIARTAITHFHQDKSISKRSQLSFKFMRGRLGWKILDISANGDSAILYYRDVYMDHVRQTMEKQYLEQMQAQAKAMQEKIQAKQAAEADADASKTDEAQAEAPAAK